MIISASRRTDIPAYYCDWFFNRIKERYVLVRNPINIHRISRINLSPDAVDCIVFWTKNPKPMLERLNELEDYSFYFQFTLNSYEGDVETNLPSKNDYLIGIFKSLSDKIGPDKVIWRYDPIFLSRKYTMDYHIEHFGELTRQLKGYTKKCTISFMDFYPGIKRNIKELEIFGISFAQERQVAEKLSKIAFENGLKMDTCAEKIELSGLGIAHAKCIDDELISKITGSHIRAGKDKNQRLECGCVSSIDIGAYNTCRNGCRYCYANHSMNMLYKNVENYDADSPLLCSHIGLDDAVNERNVKSFKEK
ncbi:MAG: DUF1848 domain-containing protein [Clostridiales bacterium]|nr:DUF1848 domain-containing protein [Clostridiales bacterium]